ncbi:MAG: hypothetical protein LBT68_01770 [Spirochaetales bacterium]|jgi:hypothetical protein|nr:hypothetical protein [Spirochaetales bacterium]
MRNRLLIFGLCAVILGLAAYGISETFEIYPKETWARPSREARINAYLALERWLEKTGHPVRIVSGGEEFFPESEAVCVAQASRVDWKDTEKLLAWVMNGASLVVSLERAADINTTGLADFLEFLGVRRRTDAAAENRNSLSKDTIDFDKRLRLKPVKENPNRKRMICRKDSGGAIRLITVPLGKGSVTVCGVPRFMMSSRLLRDAENAALAWGLTGARDAANAGIVFLRGELTRENFYSGIRSHGELVFLIVSAVILIIAGFWMVVPVFGRPARDPERPGRPLRERFLAEGRFLKKFNALESYLDAYIQEIKLKLRTDASDVPAAFLASRCGLDARDIEYAFRSESGVKMRDFLRRKKILETILESL